MADNQGTIDGANPRLSAVVFTPLGCVRLTDWITKCSSFYTTGMCASNALADNQGTIVRTSNLCVDGKVDEANTLPIEVTNWQKEGDADWRLRNRVDMLERVQQE